MVRVVVTRVRAAGAPCASGRERREISGAERHVKQPYGAARRNRSATRAEAAVACTHYDRLSVCSSGSDRLGKALEGERLENVPETAGEKSGPLGSAVDVGGSARYRVAWVKGHSGHIENERVDAIANAAIDRLLAGTANS
jgi:hypothetical protein